MVEDEVAKYATWICLIIGFLFGLFWGYLIWG